MNNESENNSEKETKKQAMQLYIKAQIHTWVLHTFTHFKNSCRAV